VNSSLVTSALAAARAFPPFRPHPLLRSRHVQTVFGAWGPLRVPRDQAELHHVTLADGDQVVVHDDRPASWSAGGRCVLLIHGLGGSHASSYMRRIAHKLNRIGVRTFRLDFRGCGAGFGLAKRPYFGGCSADVASVVRTIEQLCPASLVTLIGFSLGANVILKLLGEQGPGRLAGVDSAFAVSPPVDLAACSDALLKGLNRAYDRYFVKSLMQRIRKQAACLPDSPAGQFRDRPRTLLEFDDRFTAPTWGYAGAQDYYRQCSSLKFIEQITVPTVIVTSLDDPFIPSAPVAALALPDHVHLHLTPGGGHLGFIARRTNDADWHWLDWRVVAWVQALDAASPTK